MSVVSDPVLYMLIAAPFTIWAMIGILWWRLKGHRVFGPWLDMKMHILRVWLINKEYLPKEYLHTWTRQSLARSHEELEIKLGLERDETKKAWGRWENSTRMANSYANDRMKIIEQLDRFGMTLDMNNEIVVRGPLMTPAVIRNGEVIKPAQMIPILAKGLTPAPPPPYDGGLVPIICWYRLVPDPKIKGQINEEYSHYEDPEQVLKDPKNRKNKKVVYKMPTSNVPTSRGGTAFSGKWVWHQKFRTEEASPRIVDDENTLIKERATGRFKELREQYKSFPDSGPIFGEV